VRKIVGPLVALIGAFLVVVGIMAQVYAPDKLMKTPIDSETVTSLSGTAQLSDGTELNEFPVLAWSITLGNVDKSDDDVAVFRTSNCLVKDEGDIDGCVDDKDPGDRLLSATTDDFANDRVTGLSVNDPKYLPPEAVPHEGLTNKWPFEAEKKTYPYWDGVVGAAVDAVYTDTESIEGHETYIYHVSVKDAPTEIAAGVPGTYNDEKDIWVSSTTGSIVKQVDHQERLDDDGSPVLILDLAFTDEEVQTKIDEAKDDTDGLNLVRQTLPLIGYAVGIPLLPIGLALTFLANRGSRGRRAA
jgi:hypothetical protein